jgi:DNA modification methylase
VKPHYADDDVTLYAGDCIEVMRGLPDNSVDAVVTDPPYGLDFMGKHWDTGAVAFSVGMWAEALRVLKPGGHLVAFGGTRTWHRLACAIEDAGFEIRDNLAWIYGSGFPKSLDVSKAIDKAAGAQREVVGPGRWNHVKGSSENQSDALIRPGGKHDITAPATPEAQQWQGWGTALKPAYEPIVLARKPLSGTVAATVLEWGTGALNIDGCRVGYGDEEDVDPRLIEQAGAGRWPPNIILDLAAAEEVDAQSGDSPGRVGMTQTGGKVTFTVGEGMGPKRFNLGQLTHGGASRFFPVFDWPFLYHRKAGSAERPRVPGEANGSADFLGGTKRCKVCGCMTIKPPNPSPSCGHGDFERIPTVREDAGTVAHPTVKPLDLMRWLVRLVTPPGGVVLEPFAGSGTTAEACVVEGFRCIAIEREADYLPLIVQRLSKPIERTLL